MTAILAIDAGTTGVTALVVSAKGEIVAKGYEEFGQHFPHPGWVEHVPESIWQATLEACRAALRGVDTDDLVGIGITNQRETVVLWDRETLGSPRRAIVWQDRRTSSWCASHADSDARVRELTGLRLDPYFTGTKLAWIREHEPHTWAHVESGRYAVGTVESYLIARMTRGLHHVSDVSNASRTLLFSLETGDWSSELCALFGVPADALPELVPNWGTTELVTDPRSFLDLSLPIAGMAGDQQSALFGQACFEVGESKCTYGTGSFILTNTGSVPQRSEGLLTSPGWRSPSGETTYVLEGAIFVTGAAVQWLRDGLQIIGSAAETEALARTVTSTDGLYFVPALTGLGAPHWDPEARGTIVGITRGTTRAHVVRATLEAIAYEVRDVMATLPTPLSSLKVDGGASANDLLCQLQADQLDVAVSRPRYVETTGLGAAFLAGLGVGVWDSFDEIKDTWALDRTFSPAAGIRDAADASYAGWTRAVERAKGWA